MQGASPLLPATQKLKKQLLWHTARPAHPGHAVLFRAAFAVCAEQGNRVQFPDMCRIWTIRLSSCDCGASPRPRDARISKDGHWNCCNGGERRPDERVGGCPLNASVRRPTKLEPQRKRILWGRFWCTKAADHPLLFRFYHLMAGAAHNSFIRRPRRFHRKPQKERT